MSADDSFFRIIGNLRTLRAKLRDVPVEQIRELAQKLAVLIQEREAEELEEQRLHQEREQKLKVLKETLENLGIDPADLLSEEQKSFKATRQRKKTVKYEYTDNNGKYRTWTGQGRTPRPIQSQIDNDGKNLEDFLIKK